MSKTELEPDDTNSKDNQNGPTEEDLIPTDGGASSDRGNGEELPPPDLLG